MNPAQTKTRERFTKGFYDWYDQQGKETGIASGILFSMWVDACYFATGEEDPAVYARDLKSNEEDSFDDLFGEFAVEGEDLLG